MSSEEACGAMKIVDGDLQAGEPTLPTRRGAGVVAFRCRAGRRAHLELRRARGLALAARFAVDGDPGVLPSALTPIAVSFERGGTGARLPRSSCARGRELDDGEAR